MVPGWRGLSGRRGGLLLRTGSECRHVEVATVVPDRSGLEGDGGDQPERALSIRERANGLGPPFDLSVEALDSVGRVDPGPVTLWKREELRRGVESVFEARKRLWDLRLRSES